MQNDESLTIVPHRILVVGASVRGLLESAIRTGYPVHGADFFADWDTKQICQPNLADHLAGKAQFSRIENYSDAPKLATSTGCDAVVLTGGAETEMELVRTLDANVRLMGHSESTLGRLSNEVSVFELLSSHDLRVPETVRELDSASIGNGSIADWIQKRNGSSAGLGVLDATANKTDPSDDVYFQRRVGGKNYSAVFVSFVNDGHDTRLLGVTKQLVGEQRLGASKYGYCGSIGPTQVASSIKTQMLSVASTLAREYKMAGVWGIDFVVDEDTAYPVDINARPTASCELMENALASTGSGIFDLHVRSCAPVQAEANALWFDREVSKSTDHHSDCEGKAILFNRMDKPIEIKPGTFELLRSLSRLSTDPASSGRWVADIPHPGTQIEPGHPILTARILDADLDKAEHRLLNWADQLYEQLTM